LALAVKGKIVFRLGTTGPGDREAGWPQQVMRGGNEINPSISRAEKQRVKREGFAREKTKARASDIIKKKINCYTKIMSGMMEILNYVEFILAIQKKPRRGEDKGQTRECPTLRLSCEA